MKKKIKKVSFNFDIEQTDGGKIEKVDCKIDSNEKHVSAFEILLAGITLVEAGTSGFLHDNKVNGAFRRDLLALDFAVNQLKDNFAAVFTDDIDQISGSNNHMVN